MTGDQIRARLRALTQVPLARANHRPAAVLVPRPRHGSDCGDPRLPASR
jgi:hypothetical protein